MSSFFAPLTVRLFNRRVGTDRFGNTYYESHAKMAGYDRRRRFVLYKGPQEATAIPPEWHGWMHHTSPEPLPETRSRPWFEEHRPNPTGTPAAYHPPGHQLSTRGRPKTDGEYEAWTPGS
jgi:NADH:ubiquinone oxidoreductase subunit